MADVLPNSTLLRPASAVEGAGLNAWLAEARELLKLAGPLVITQLAQMAIMTTDIVMLSRYSEAALAGVAPRQHGILLHLADRLGSGGCRLANDRPYPGRAPEGSGQCARGRAHGAVVGDGPVRCRLTALLLFTQPLMLFFGQKPELARAASLF